MRASIILAAIVLSAATASAEPLYRMSLRATPWLRLSGEPCQFDVCQEPTSLEIEAIIEDLTISRDFDEDGAFTTNASYVVREWAITSATGEFSLLPGFAPGTTSGSGHSSIYSVPNFRRCCAGFGLNFNDGVNSVHIGLFGDTSFTLDPWLNAIVLPPDGLTTFYTPATGMVTYYGGYSLTEIAPVPEPGTLTLFGSAAILAGARALRRAKQRAAVRGYGERRHMRRPRASTEKSLTHS